MWFQRIKLAQLWNVSYSTDSISSMLHALYELTYKYQTLQNQKFHGHPKRLNNILSALEASARNVITDMADILLPVFERWLDGHALLSPRTWASKRADELDEFGLLDDEIKFYSNKTNIHDFFRRLDEPVKTGQAPYLAKWFKQFKSDLLEANDDGKGEYTQEKYINEMKFSDAAEYFNDSMRAMLNSISEIYPEREVYIEVLQFGLFPMWYEYWSLRGIEETRARVEKAHQMLQHINTLPINQALASINIVLNTTHQTGDMLEYVAEVTNEYPREIKRTMDLLSNRTDFSEWDNQLQSVGMLSQSIQPNEKLI